MAGSTSAMISAAVRAGDLGAVATQLGAREEGKGRELGSQGTRGGNRQGRGRTDAATALKGISGDGELGARVCGEVRGVHGWTQRSVVSALDTVRWPEDGREHVGEEVRDGACG